MTEKNNQKKNLYLKAIAVFTTLILAGILSYSFITALIDGADWKKESTLKIVNPDFEQKDANKAKTIPDFSLKDRFGNQIKLSEFHLADIIIIHIWSSSCPPCIQELPMIQEMDNRLSSMGKVVLITITTDEKWEALIHVFPTGTNLRILFDPEEKVTKKIFGTSKFPETFILDKNRKIRARFDGIRRWYSKEILEYIASFK